MRMGTVEDTTGWSTLEVEEELYETSQSRNEQRLIAETPNEPNIVELRPDGSKGAISVVLGAGSYAGATTGTETDSRFDLKMVSTTVENPDSI